MQLGKTNPQTEIELDMTPMIDVVFQLLIFFMLTIEFKTLEGKLAAYLPKDVGVNNTPAEPKEKVEIRVKVVNEGSKVDPFKPDTPWSGSGPYKFGPDREVNERLGERIRGIVAPGQHDFARAHETAQVVDVAVGVVIDQALT